MDNRQIGIIGVTGLVSLIIILFVFQNRQAPQFEDGNTTLNLNSTGSNQTPQVTELSGQEIKVGTGAAVAAGDNVKVHYIGSFLDGKKFDSSYDRNQPFQIAVGAGAVIPGFDRGLVGMKVGGKRKLLIPANMAYGEKGQGPIPPNTPLQFEIELLEIIPKESPTPEATPTETPTPTPEG
jgi:FKBP-type peptidyl-prolyl cis-trans isomerase